MERERFGVRSFEGPRNDAGLGIPIFSDTGFGNLNPAAHFMGSLIPMAPWQWHVFFDDFDEMPGLAAAATDTDTWDVHLTEGGAGEAAIALADGDGGHILLTNDAADNDVIALQKKGESFLYEAGKVLAFGCRFKVSDPTQSDVLVGLAITDTTPLDVTDGIFFQKDDGDAFIDFHVEKNNTASSALAIATLGTDTFVTLGFVYDGRRIWYGANGVALGSLPVTNAPDDENITPTIVIQNGEAVAKTMTVDYIYAAKNMGRT